MQGSTHSRTKIGEQVTLCDNAFYQDGISNLKSVAFNVFLCHYHPSIAMLKKIRLDNSHKNSDNFLNDMLHLLGVTISIPD